ncbi:MAG: protein kinase [Planctomycetota bacterium]
MRGANSMIGDGCVDDDGQFDPEETRESNVSEPLTRKSESAELPVGIDEYSILKLLGRGGFGIVYLAFDNTLHREVALKIPHAQLVNKRKTADLYLGEARAIASLDHPNIIPVFRAASTSEIPCYIVTKLIRGSHLGRWFRKTRPSIERLATLLADVADALQYAHDNGIVHRDIKPGNILVDEDGHPYVADFGLALRDADIKSSTAFVGTPAYMSPEQARGEGHRVDGRSDVFALGIVLYELLTGKRPFRGSSNSELFDQILYCDPDHPRDLNSAIPIELARICLKALSKARSDRYASAKLMASELRNIGSDSNVSAEFSIGPASTVSPQPMTVTATTGINDDSDDPSTSPVVPKGLRPFGVHDAEFFPRLLPGPQDRLGVPEAIRFWISALTSRGAEKAITVGLIYGPSGCGKSSLVRAGIIPRMPADIETYYIQATAENTEADLISQIATRSVFTGQEPVGGTDIVETFTRLRRSRNQRTVIFIDQFEQWLFANPDCVRAPLTEALRHCDGDFLQCVLLVRDDFWMGVTRLMQTLDLPIGEDVNVTAVDLFDTRHARQVLALFGAAHARLPASQTELTPAQHRFLDAAVEYLAKDGRVICVQLALLTEMLKGRSWDDTVGVFGDGGADLGMRFFDETFDSESAPRRIRMHAEGTRRVLKTLLPELGSPIKGALRTEQELFEASGYADQETFRQMVTLLDRELHLITPTDRGGDSTISTDSSNLSSDVTGYQLTHDFLINPIRQWIEYHSQATAQGQARARLDQFAELYRLHPRQQSLPTMAEFYWIRKNLGDEKVNESQREVMTAARHLHGKTLRNASFLVLAGCLAIAATLFGISRYGERVRNESAFEGFIASSIADAAERSNVLREDEALKQSATELIRGESQDLRKLRAAMLLVNEEPEADELLSDFLMTADAEEVVDIVTTLDISFEKMAGDALAVWEDPGNDVQSKLRAACVMVRAPATADTISLPENLSSLCDFLIAENPIRIPRWREAFEPISSPLVAELCSRMRAPDRVPGNLNAANLIAAYADSAEQLASVIPYAQAGELSVLTDALGKESIDALRVAWENDRNFEDDSRPWNSAWWWIGLRKPVEVATQPLPKEVLHSLDACETAVGRVAMVSHRVEAARLQTMADLLWEHGYRVANVLPYLDKGTEYAQVYWVRDSAESLFRWGLTAEQLKQENAAQTTSGWLADDVVAYDTETGHRYACVWIRLGDDSDSVLTKSDMYIEVHQDRHQPDGWERTSSRGFWLNRAGLQVMKDDGAAYLTSIRWQSDFLVGFKDDWDLTSDTFASLKANCRSHALLNCKQRKGTFEEDPALATQWWENLPIKTKTLDYQPRREHLRAAQSLFEQGYRPVSVDNGAMEKDGIAQFGSVWWKWIPDAKLRVARARRRANLAFALLQLGDDTRVKESLVATDDPELRGAVIAGFAQLNLPCRWLTEQVFGENDLLLRRSCAMALSMCSQNSVSESLRNELTLELPVAYGKAVDSGVISAFESIATAWGISLDRVPTISSGEIRSVAGHRLPIIRPAATIWIGSRYGEPGRDHLKEPMTPVIIDRSYAIATTAVTFEQFREFRRDAGYPESYADDVRCPMVNVSWIDAVKYCRWLSEQEGLPKSEMCYPEMDDIGPNMILDDDYLDRIGYRLPTEPEWEFACRGGSESSRWFGFDPERLDEHAWTTRNSDYRLHPVGRLLPNDYGLFDMLGNAMDLCHPFRQRYEGYVVEPLYDSGTEFTYIDDSTRVPNRGGAMLYQPLDARASQREFHGVETPRVYLTFRIARTVRE